MTTRTAGGRAWSTPADVVRTLRRRWDSGEFLTSFASGRAWQPLEVALRGPSARELATRFDEVQEWARGWRRAGALRVETRAVGGRTVGQNDVPRRAWIDSYDQLWSLLDVTRDVRRFTALLDATRERAPRLVEWMVGRPHEVLRHHDRWDRLVDTVLWIDERARPDMYLRQIDVPGVDTKFVEAHRGILAALLDRQLADHRIDPTRPVSDFAGRYRFRKKPDYVRFRWLDGTSGWSELTVRTAELAARPLDVTSVFVVENEVTYLAFPPVERSVAVFGGGYSLSRLTPLSWLSDRTVVYWGDIDTHGFVMLSRLRQAFGHVRSMLMDRATLLRHEDQWVTESSPVDTPLELLTPDEAALYADLVEGSFGPAVRLEQERVSYSAIEHALRHATR